MRLPFYFAPALVLVFAAPALMGQAPISASWSGVLHRPLDHVLVQARVVTFEGSQYLQFRNEGQDQINFHFSFNGEDPYTNPRIHINAHKRSPFLPLPTGVSGSNLKFVMLRTGRDQGSVLSD